jgi:hypothetical protein
MMNAIIFATVGTSALRNPGIGDVVAGRRERNCEVT